MENLAADQRIGADRIGLRPRFQHQQAHVLCAAFANQAGCDAQPEGERSVLCPLHYRTIRLLFVSAARLRHRAAGGGEHRNRIDGESHANARGSMRSHCVAGRRGLRRFLERVSMLSRIGVARTPL